MRLADLSLSAQTAYAELLSQTQAFARDNALAGLVGAFHKRTIKRKAYWYFGYRDMDQKLRMPYVGPDSERVQALVQRFAETRRHKPLAPPARMAIAAGCASVVPKHFRVIRRLAEYGFFRAGAILIGTHAFLAGGNVLGVRWLDEHAEADVDLTEAGQNISLALPATFRLDAHSALESLELGLLPLNQFSGKVGPQSHNPTDQELRLDFLTAAHSGAPPVMAALDLVPTRREYLDFCLTQPVQGCVISSVGSCGVNLPAPERYAVHKLVVGGERPASEQKSTEKDLLQAGSLIGYFLETGQAEVFNAAWQEALSQSKEWQTRAKWGRAALLRIAPELRREALWRKPKCG